MMLYAYKCEEGHLNDEYRSIADRDKPMKCKVCKKKAKRILFHDTPVHWKGAFEDGPPGDW